MKSFEYFTPTYFVFGRDSEEKTASLLKRFCGRRVLLVYGGGSIKRSGLYERVVNSMRQEEIYFTELAGIQPNPVSEPVYRGIEIAKREQLDFILAVGGGSVIDTGKAIAAGAKYDGDFWDFFSGKAHIEQALPVGTILTLSAAGSEGSPNTVITREDGPSKRGAGSDVLRPVFSILNPALTQTLPPYQTASGITDMIAHIVERYFTRTTRVETSDRLAEGLLKAICKEGLKAMADPDDYEARANIMWAGMLAHNDLCGVDREQDWASHALEHELSAWDSTIAHGAGLAVIMPVWMRYVVKQDIARFAQFAVRVWDCEPDFIDPTQTALEGIRRFQEFLKAIGMPGSLTELGIKGEAIDHFVRNLGVSRQKPLGRFVPLGPEDVRRIYEEAL